MLRTLLQALVAFASLGLLAAGPAGAQPREVTVGYQLIYGPWAVPVASGAIEQATGWQIRWVKLESGAGVIEALRDREIDIGFAGSSPIAAGISEGVDLRLVWILDDIASAEQLVVRDGSGIDPVLPESLRGHAVAVPFGSTTHFHLLFALETWGIPKDAVRIVDMEPNRIAAAWDRGEIDAAFIWDPVLGRLEGGRTMVTSGELSAKGRPTFDGIVASAGLVRDDPDGLARLIRAVADANAAYRADPGAWDPGSAPIRAIVTLFGDTADSAVRALGLYRFPSLDEQAGPTWLGGGAEGRAAAALRATAEFLREQGRITGLADDYARFVDPSIVERATALDPIPLLPQ